MNTLVKYSMVLCLISAGHTVFAQGITDTVHQFNDVLIQKNMMESTTVYYSKRDNTLANFAHQEGRKFSDILGDYSGAYLKNYGVGQLSSISINGSSAAQTDILWNGIKLNSPTSGQVDLSLFDLSGGDRLSIFTNMQSGGRTNVGIGGTVALDNQLDLGDSQHIKSYNVIRLGSFAERTISTSNVYGAGGFKGATKIAFLSADNDFPFKNDTKIGAPVVHETNAATKQLSFTQQLEYTFRKPYSIGANLWITDADRQLPPAMSADVSHEREWDQSYRGMVYLNGQKKDFHFSFKSAYLYDHLKYISPDAHIDSRSSTEAYRNIFAAYYVLPYHLQLNGELHYDHESAKSTGFDTAKHRDISGLDLALSYKGSGGINTGISGHGDLLGTHSLPLSSTIYIGLNKFYKDNYFTLTLNGNRNYRLPALNDLYWNEGGNPTLRPEKAWKSSLHFLYSRSYWLMLMADGYYNYVTDWILWHPTSSGIWMPDNVKRVLSRGGTVGLKLQNRLDTKDKRFLVVAYVSYSYTKTTSLDAVSANDNSQGKQLIYVPLHNLTASLQLQYYRFYIRAISSYTGDRYTTTDNSISLSSYYLIHLEAGKDFYINGQQIGVSFRANNITNTQYQMVSDRPMPGRNYEGTIRINLVK